MRLFLSSQDFGKYAKKVAELVGNNKKAAFLKNAQDDKPAQERNFSTPEKKRMFEATGFEFEEIDLRHYFGQSKKLATKLKPFGSIWCAGGNTFILRRAMKASGLDKILTDFLHKDQILYGGWSAGACITAPSLRGIEYGDRPQPDIVPDNYPSKETVWEGLGLVPFMIVPHCKSDWFGQEADKSIAYLKKHDMLYKSLEDGQVIIVDGDKVELLK
jgi:dipeptidase E